MPQQVPITISGFEDRSLTVELAGLTTSARLLIDGKPAPSSKQRGAYTLRRKNGKEVTVRLQTIFPDPLPKLIVDGKAERIGPPIPWYAFIWSSLPLILVVGGGFIGGVLGVTAATLNVQLFRAPWTTPRKYFATAGLSIAACLVLFVLARVMDTDVIPVSHLNIPVPHSTVHSIASPRQTMPAPKH